MTLFLSADDVRPLVSMSDAMASLEEAFRRWGDPWAFNLPRQRMPIPDNVVNVLAGVVPGGDVYGVRTSTPGRHGNMLMLSSVSERRLLAVLACGPITDMRTGAASGVATKYLARADASRVGIIGSGRTARTQLLAMGTAKHISEITVYSGTEANRVRFAEEMTQMLGVRVMPTASAEDAVAAADIIVTATSATEPVLLGRWVPPGAHINAIGANALERRELDDDAYVKAAIVAIDDVEQGKREAGALCALDAAGRLTWDKVTELGDIVRGAKPGRRTPSDITLFHSLGLGFADVAYGYAVYKKALEAGVGKEVG
jgi:alanine dehydrogenase